MSFWARGFPYASLVLRRPTLVCSSLLSLFFFPVPSCVLSKNLSKKERRKGIIYIYIYIYIACYLLITISYICFKDDFPQFYNMKIIFHFEIQNSYYIYIILLFKYQIVWSCLIFLSTKLNILMLFFKIVRVKLFIFYRKIMNSNR